MKHSMQRAEDRHFDRVSQVVDVGVVVALAVDVTGLGREVDACAPSCGFAMFGFAACRTAFAPQMVVRSLPKFPMLRAHDAELLHRAFVFGSGVVVERAMKQPRLGNEKGDLVGVKHCHGIALRNAKLSPKAHPSVSQAKVSRHPSGRLPVSTATHGTGSPDPGSIQRTTLPSRTGASPGPAVRNRLPTLSCMDWHENTRSLDDPPHPRLDLGRLFRFHRRTHSKSFLS